MLPTHRDADGPVSGLPVLGVIARRRTYHNLLVLLLLFPVGILNFVVVVTGLALGVALLPVGVGLVVLPGVLIVATWLGASYARLLSALSDRTIRCEPFRFGADGFWAGIRRVATSSRAYLFVAALFVTFPLGVASFVYVVVVLALSFALLAAPIAGPMAWSDYRIAPGWVLDTPVEWLGAALVGAGLLVAGLWFVTVAGEAVIRAATVVLEYGDGTQNR